MLHNLHLAPICGIVLPSEIKPKEVFKCIKVQRCVEYSQKKIQPRLSYFS